MKRRPDTYHGKTVRVKTNCGSVYITLNKDVEGELREVRITIGKSGYCARGMLEFISILLSIYLHSDVDIAEKLRVIKRHADGVNCGEKFEYNGEQYLSCLDLVANFCIDELDEFIKKKKVEAKPNIKEDYEKCGNNI